MDFVVVVKARLSKPYAHWQERFDAEGPMREANGVVCIFRGPVMGEQAVVFAMRTKTPRAVHDMMYHPAVRPGIEESGLVIGSEQISLCQGDV